MVLQITMVLVSPELWKPRTMMDVLVVGIANTGREISDSDRELILERFPVARPLAGCPGMATARDLLRAHGGDPRLSPSEPGWLESGFRLPAGS